MDVGREPPSAPRRWPALGWAAGRLGAPVVLLGALCAGLLLSAGRAPGLHGARVEAPAGARFEQKETKEEEKRKAEKDVQEAEGDMQKMACDALNVAFAKVVVPKLNSKTIPQTINKIGYNPMQQVVSTKSMQLTDLTGLINFTITKLTTSKVYQNSSVAEASGFSTTATAHMEMEAEIPITMTAHAVFEHGGKSDDDRRLEDSSDSSDVKFDGTMNINKFNMKMPITAVVTITSGTSLNTSNILENMKHMTIESANSGIPDIGFDVSLQCQRRLGLMDNMEDDAMDDAKKGAEDAGKDAAKDMHVECHAASVGAEAAKPAIDLVMDDKFTSIIQNVLNKQLPMTLGEPKDKNTVSGKMKLSVSGGRRLSSGGDATSAASEFLADNNSKEAVGAALAEIAGIPSGDVSTDLALDEDGDIDLNYSLIAPDGDIDAYDIRETLMNHTANEVSAKITEHVQGYGAGWDVFAHNAYASVMEPSPELVGALGSDGGASGTLKGGWGDWWLYAALFLVALLVVGLAALLARNYLASRGGRKTRGGVSQKLGGQQGAPERGSQAVAAPPTAPMTPVPQGAVTPGYSPFVPPPAPFGQAPYVQAPAAQIPSLSPSWRADMSGHPGFSYGQLPFGQSPTGLSFPYAQPQAQYYAQGQSPFPQAQVPAMQPPSPYSQPPSPFPQAQMPVMQPPSPYSQLHAAWDAQPQSNYGYGYAASGSAPWASPALQSGYQPVSATPFQQ